MAPKNPRMLSKAGIGRSGPLSGKPNLSGQTHAPRLGSLTEKLTISSGRRLADDYEGLPPEMARQLREKRYLRERRRVTVQLDEDLEQRLLNVSNKSRMSQAKVIQHLLAGTLPNTERDIEAFTAGEAPSWRRHSIVIKNRAQIIRYSSSIIVALQEILDYDPIRHHNRPPPQLWLDSPDYLTELRNLVAELKELNGLLRAKKEHRHAATGFAKHVETFLHSYAGALGGGAATVTIGLIAAMLYEAGVGRGLISMIWEHAKIPK